MVLASVCMSVPLVVLVAVAVMTAAVLVGCVVERSVAGVVAATTRLGFGVVGVV